MVGSARRWPWLTAGWPWPGLHPQDLPWGETQLNLVRCQVLLGAGRLAEAGAIAEAGYQAAVADRSSERTGGWAGFRGLVAKAEGRVATAEAWLREAVALLDEQDPYRFMRWCLAELASVAALAGDQEAAVGWLDRADARAGEANRYFDPWVELDKAWVAAAAGELTRAVDLATRAADMARASKQFTFEAVALYDVARLGAPAGVRQRLEELAGLLEGRLAAVLASSAVALAADDGAALDRVGAAFQDLGALLLAVEAKAAAARAHRAAGRDASANASQERAAALAAACQGARTPGLGPAMPVSVLTPREREVAMLAAAHTSSREIATRLHLSVRTVDNHLGRVYAKLGVSSRAQLATLLEVGHRGRPGEKRTRPCRAGDPCCSKGLQSVDRRSDPGTPPPWLPAVNSPSRSGLDGGERTTTAPSYRSPS